MKKQLLLLGLLMLALSSSSQPIDRQRVVSRNNPHVTTLDSLQSLTVGNGGFAFTVDATGLQSFPQQYRGGVPLGTMSDWGWHSFPNIYEYQPAEALKDYDFGHTGKLPSATSEPYSVENKDEQRAKKAANYLRSNPHRLHLGRIGLMMEEALLSDIAQTLDLWTGTIDSRYDYDGQPWHVRTACHPTRDMVAAIVESDAPKNVVMEFPYPTGQHSDDACDFEPGFAHRTDLMHTTPQSALLRHQVDSVVYFIHLKWEGSATVDRVTAGEYDTYNTFRLHSNDRRLAFSCEFFPASEQERPLDTEATVADIFTAAAGHWQHYWQTGGIVDFSECTDPRAPELERRVVLSQYLLAVNCAGDTPPQETGLTYNSWFGKFHLEMIWWHQAQFALWGHPELLEHSLDWYFRAAPMARQIARRQGFPGLRWMKMTDPSAQEAPSKVGSFLIWQQPHLIHLAELLRRAEQATTGSGDRIVRKYWPLVEPTAQFMCAFADYDSTAHRYVLKGCIPAQETLRAAETVNPPFELSYWHWGLQAANEWAERMEGGLRSDWLHVANHLSALAFGADSLYLAAETATQTYSDIRFTSDHPAVLGAYGILPLSPQVDTGIMLRTLDWIWDQWNWDKTWGWDYPMVAMNAARLGETERAVGALLMPRRTNTYLVSGHNYQDQRLRLYLPGNGGLLTAIAMMCAGWDGSTGQNPGFPDNGEWNVRWEGLLPLP